MPRARLRHQIERFAAVLRERPAFAGVYGVVSFQGSRFALDYLPTTID
jgi:hypothetical protein